MIKKLLLGFCGIIFCASAILCGAFLLNAESKKTFAYAKKGEIEWDEDSKQIYANQNSLLIVADGTGTTVYLDLAEGETLETLSGVGDGVLGGNDVSLYEMYQANTSKYSVAPPADGADLSDWSIVVGLKNPRVNQSSSSQTKITMLGGQIKNVYGGSASFEAESATKLLGSVEFTMLGGKVDTVFTDQGFVLNNSFGKADGSTTQTFNLFGGEIKKLIRSLDEKLVYYTKVNFKGNLKIDEIDSNIFEKNRHFELVGNLEETSDVSFNLDSSFAQSDKLFKCESSEFLQALNLNTIKILNASEHPTGWEVYKSKDGVRFGLNTVITNVQIVGEAKVGETLTVQVSPTGAALQTCSWFRLDDSLKRATWLGSGTSYTLTDSDGGKFIYVFATDKNDTTNDFKVDLSVAVERIEKPVIEIVSGKKFLYANGSDLLVVKDGKGTTVYLDKGIIGELDAEDKSLADAGIENAPANASNLKEFSISIGASVNKPIGAVTVTVLGGEIKQIVNKSKFDVDVYEYFVVNLFGGKVGLVQMNKNKIDGETYVYVGGSASAKIAGVQNSKGTDTLSISKKLENAKIKILLDDSAELENVAIVAENKDWLSASQIFVCDVSGNPSTLFELKKVDDTFVLAKLQVQNKNLSALAIVLICVGSVLFAVVVAFVTWFLLWKYKKVSAGFMKTIFEKVNCISFKKKKTDSKVEIKDVDEKPAKKETTKKSATKKKTPKTEKE